MAKETFKDKVIAVGTWVGKHGNEIAGATLVSSVFLFALGYFIRSVKK